MNRESSPNADPGYMYPLHVNNQYQYFENATSTEGSKDYSCYTTKIIKDTTIEDITYYAFDNSGDFFRYDSDSNRVYLRYNDVEGIYFDFLLENGSTFSQFVPGSHGYRNVTVQTGQITLFDTIRNSSGFSYVQSWGGSDYKSYSTIFAENLGLAKLTSYSNSPGPDVSKTTTLICAIIYDSSGAFTYYTNDHKPEIIFNPFYSLDSSPEKFFDVEVSHTYNAQKYFHGLYRDGVVYIDSVYIEYFYKKDSTESGHNLIAGNRVTNSELYNFAVPIDIDHLQNGYKFYYRVVANDKALISQYSFSPESGFYIAEYDSITSISQHTSIKSFRLNQNFPNPFNPLTQITYTIPNKNEFGPKSSKVLLEIFNIVGERIITLVNSEQKPGDYKIEFNGSNWASGVYIYRLVNGNESETKKMLLLK